MLSINTNLSSLIAQSSMKQSTTKLNQAIERMTTGFKINHASDNAANYSISTNMTTKIGAYNVAEDNVAMGLDLISTAEGTLNQMQDKLERLRALQEQASNGTYGEDSLNAINAEANALVDEIERLYSTAEYNGLKLFGGSTEGGADAVSAALTNESTPIQTFALARTVTVDESKRVSNVSSFTEGETYYITDSTDLVALQDLVNGGATTSNVTFELTEDIDMQGVSFRGIGYFYGTFNGNGHVIKNLTIDTTENNVGLFRYARGPITDVILENVDISGGSAVGGLAGAVSNTAAITGCSVSGVVNGVEEVGGLIGYTNFVETIENCSSDCNVTGENRVGGLIGSTTFDISFVISECFTTGSVLGSSHVGGFVGYMSDVDVTNSYTSCKITGSDSSTTGVLFGSSYSDSITTLSNVRYNSEINPGLVLIGTDLNGIDLSGVIDDSSIQPNPDNGSTDGGTTPDTPTIPPPSFTPAPDTIVLQIGASSNWASQVGVSTKFELNSVDDLRMIGLDLTTDYLTQIDDMLALVSEKQTHFGAVSNRLESVLEEITIQRDNLVSSRSTIRDANIAEVSSSYIQQQILQQASATLLATANQSPSIALQLI